MAKKSAIDLSEFTSERRVGGSHTWERWIATLSPDQKSKLDLAIADLDITAASIARVLAKWGCPMKPTAMARRITLIRCQ